MTNIDFSVIIPTLNRPNELEACLRALSSIEYARDRFEIIVVDDGGVTPLTEVLSKYKGGAEIRMVRQKECMGPGSARNTGAAASRGRYLAFTDDDCMPRADWLSAFEESLRLDRHLLVGGRILNALPANPYSTASQIIMEIVYQYYRLGGNTPRFFATNNIAVQSETFREIGGFSPSFRTSEDRDFCDRWIQAGYRLAYAPDAVIYHAHNLDLLSFWKQHMGYGRGAWRFFRAFSRRHGGQSSIEPGFYEVVARRLPALILKQPQGRALLFLLMAVWQIANFTGFFAEAVSSRHSADIGVERP